MPELGLQHSPRAAPAIPVSRGPRRGIPRDVASDATLPPRHPPSRTASREPTPRLQLPGSVRSGTPHHGDRQPRSPDAAVPRPSDGRTAEQRRQRLVSGRPSSILFTLEEAEAHHTRTGTMESILFEVDPSTVPSRRRSALAFDAAADERTDEITFEVVSNSPALRGQSTAWAPSAARGESISFVLEPSQPGQQQQPMKTLAVGSHTPKELSDAGIATPRKAPNGSREELVEQDERRVRAAQGPATPMSIEGSGGSAAPQHTPRMNPPKVTALSAPAGTAAAARVKRGRTAVTPRAPQRMETKPREVKDKTRAELMNERPWRVASPGVRIDWTASKQTSPNTPSRQSPVKTRAELMNERPWREASPVTPRKPRPTSPRPQRVQEQGPAVPAIPLVAPPAPAAPPSPEDQGGVGAVVERDGSAMLGLHTTATSPTASSHEQPAAAAASAAPMVTAPPVLLRSPWAVMGDEVQQWLEMVNQSHNLREMLAVMRGREHQVARAAQRIDALGRRLARSTAELHKHRDEYVALRGVDVCGAPLRPPRAASPRRLGSLASTGRSPSAAPHDFVTRLHPSTLSPRLALPTPPRRQRSVLSDSDVSDTEREAHAEAVAAWRGERAKLHARKAMLLQRKRDLQHNIRRGTNIKTLSAVTVTSPRGPLERAAQGQPSHVDADGYDALVALRLQAREASVAQSTAQDAYAAAQRAALALARSSQERLREATARRDELEREFVQLWGSLQERLAHAQAMRDRALGRPARQVRPRQGHAGHDGEGEEGNGYSRGLSVREGAANPAEATVLGWLAEMRPVQGNEKVAQLLAAHIAGAADAASRARSRREAQREAKKASRARSRSRSESRAITARGCA